MYPQYNNNMIIFKNIALQGLCVHLVDEQHD
jgi:hypothetical protein